jgi:hypothetical protein
VCRRIDPVLPRSHSLYRGGYVHTSAVTGDCQLRRAAQPVNWTTVIYSGGPLAADIPDIDLASFALAGAKELGDKPALTDGPSSRAPEIPKSPSGKVLRRLLRSPGHVS